METIGYRPMHAPQVVRIRRQGGVSVINYDLYIGRRFNMGGWDLPESKWHNPFRVDRDGTREECLARYETYVRGRPDLMAALPELEGLTLGCWCHPERCHGDILAKLFCERVLGTGQ